MEIRYGPNAEQFVAIVTVVGHERYGDNLRAVDTQHVRTLKDGRHVIRARVRAIDSGFQSRPRDTDYLAPGARRSWSGRRAGAACWHAYRDVLAAIFGRWPNAVVIAGNAWHVTYNGRRGFEDRYPDTARVNVGSQVQPAYMPELCDCPLVVFIEEPTEVPVMWGRPEYAPSQNGNLHEPLCPDIAARIAAVEKELAG
jgi:hypothetical protein